MRIKGLAVLIVLAMTGLVPAGRATAGAAPPDVDVCGPVPEGYARCLSKVRTDVVGPAALVAGITPSQLRAAYFYPLGNTAGSGRTIAITTAFHAPTLEGDLGVFSKQFGLPSCTKKTGCLTVLDQNGGTTPPPVDSGWAAETSIDVEWVHAVAPAARIIVVEANDNFLNNLLRAVDIAARRALYVSNSWGNTQNVNDTLFDHHFTDVPGVSWFFGSGDDGVPAAYPAASPYVVAVGGTRLELNPDGTFNKEGGWSGSGGGCSPYESASAAQAAAPGPAGLCGSQRAVPDVSAVADPETGVAIYDSTPDGGASGWRVFGGTSVSGPIIAARAALTGVLVNQAYIYGRKTVAYRDITTGNNGFPCTPGYDLVTGNGTWIR